MFTHRLPHATPPQRCFTGALALAASCIACGLAPPPAHAAYTFTKIADTTITPPGSPLPFFVLDSVAYDGQNVAFIGITGGGRRGVYQWNGSTLSTIAQHGSLMPSSATTFADFRNLSLDAGHVAFQGANGNFTGFYTNLGGSLRRVADTTTIAPGSNAPFKALLTTAAPAFDVAIDGSNIAFAGFSSTPDGSVVDEGVYLEAGGALSVIVNRSTVLPDNGTETSFRGEVDANAGQVLFTTFDGVWVAEGAPNVNYRAVVDRNKSSLPGLTPPLIISSPNSFSLDAGTTAFIASRGELPQDSFLYIQQPDGVNRKIVDETEINPVTNTKFGDLSQHYSLDEGRVLFSAWSSLNNESVDAIYLSDGAGYSPIISDLATLDGKNLAALSVHHGSLVGRDFVFEARFDQDSRGLYLATAGPDLPTHTIAVEPTFDVQLHPGSPTPIVDGQPALVIDSISGSSPAKNQVLAEFPLGNIPAGAQITAAQLKLDATSAATMTVNARGYAGDGLPALSDEFISTTLAGTKSGPITTEGDVTIMLDPAVINALLGEHSHLGLRLSGSGFPASFTLAASESTTGFAPTLTLTYTTLPGDFDGDSDVDGSDFVLWQRGLGTTYDELDLADWRTNFGAVAPTTPATQVPEPTAATLLALPALFLLTPRRKATLRRPVPCK